MKKIIKKKKKLTYDTGKPPVQLRGNFGAGGMH